MSKHVSQDAKSGHAYRWVMAAGAAVMVAAMAMAVTPQGAVRAASMDEASFRGMEQAVEARWQGHEQRIPMQWLMSGAAGLYTHGGVSRLRIAEIEGLPTRIDGAELEAMARAEMSAGWSRIVRETSRDGRDQSLIYVKPEGNRLAMMVVSFDGGEMDMVQMAIHPGELSRQMRRWEHEGGRRSDGDDAGE